MGGVTLKNQADYFIRKYIRLIALVICFIFSGFLFFTYGTNHYVNANVSASGNGTSYSEGWKTFSDINWTTVQSGDSIFIAQGTYTTLLNIQTAGVVIVKSPHTGYNGTVTIDGTNITTMGGACIYVPVENVVIDGLDSSKFVLQYGKVSNISVYQIKNFTFKNATLHTNPNINPQQAFGIYLYGLGLTSGYAHGNITFENLRIVQDSGYYAGAGNADGISGGGIDGITIKGCYIVRQNSDNTPHCDVIQLYLSKNITIEDNILKHLNAGSTANKQVLYLQDCFGEIRIRNNYVEYGQPGGNNALWNRIDTQAALTAMGGMDSMIVTNNTVVYTGGTGYGIGFANNLGADFKGRGICKNNIVVAGTVRLDTTFFDYLHKDNVTNNVYYNPAGGNVQINHGDVCYGVWGQSWQTWTANGYDVNSYQTNPELTGYVPASASVIDGGVNLTALGYTDDITGNTRSGTWDIGAYEITQGGGGGGNNPPNQPANPGPSNGALNQPVNSTLSWICSDPNGDPLTYDVYFGTANNPPLTASNQSNTSYSPGALNNNTTYYWKIVAKDNQGATTAGPVWNFSTEATGSGGDITPPEVQSAEILDSVFLNIIFSEPLDQATAQNISNYSITNNINVLSASLSGSEVTLTTSPQSPGSYTVTVINVEDLAGNPIVPPNNTADYEYVSNSYSVRAKIKIFLEGPYTDSSMATNLAENSLIPLTQPYSGLPWSYDGNEGVSEIPANIVDWILLELRTGTAASTAVSRRAVLLRNDGIAVDLNGEAKITFAGVESGQYYEVIYHRNHLAIMSKNPVLLTDSSSIYDFTISEDQAFGNQSMKSLGNGKFGLYAGDGNANGSVNNSDYNSIWKKENGSLGYDKGDFDLNGGVNIVDRNSKWKPNNGKVTRVP